MLSYAGFHRARHMPHSHYAGETASALARAEEKLERIESKKDKAMAAAKTVMVKVRSKAVVSAVAGGLGFWQGMGKPVSVKGVPLPLVAGGLAFGAAVAAEMGYGPAALKQAAPYLDDFSTGCFAFESANFGNAKGLEYAAKKGAPPAATTKGHGGNDPRQFAPHVDTSIDTETPSSVPYGYR